MTYIDTDEKRKRFRFFFSLPLIESQQFVRGCIPAAHVPMRCQSSGQDDNKPVSFPFFLSFSLQSVSLLAKSAGTSLRRKLRQQLIKTRLVVGVFFGSLLSARNWSLHGAEAEHLCHRNCVYCVIRLCISLPLPLTYSFQSTTFFLSFFFDWRLRRAKGTIQSSLFLSLFFPP